MIRKQFRIAVLGVGYMGENHARVLSTFKDVTLVAVCDKNVSKAREIARKYKIRAYKDYRELLERETLDAVSICLPTILHYEVCLHVASLGKKIVIFVEKPICTSVGEARELIKQAKKKNISMMVGQIERFNGVVNEIKKRIVSGSIGKILKIQTQRFSPSPDRGKNDSVIVDLATHDIDVIIYLLGSYPRRVYAETDNILHHKSDLVTAILRFKDGVVALIEAGWLYPRKVRSLLVLGEKGMLVANYLSQELNYYPTTGSGAVKIPFSYREPLQVELRAFINAARQKEKMPVSAEDGLRALVIAEKIENSGRTKKIITL